MQSGEELSVEPVGWRGVFKRQSAPPVALRDLARLGDNTVLALESHCCPRSFRSNCTWTANAVHASALALQFVTSDD
jgi:hypothetical protein